MTFLSDVLNHMPSDSNLHMCNVYVYCQSCTHDTLYILKRRLYINVVVKDSNLKVS